MSSNALQGFKVISLPFSEKSSSPHELFIKKHVVRNQSDDKPEDQTLFVLNVPPYVTENSFKSVFSCVGRVKNVIFQDKASTKELEHNSINKTITGFKVAYIIYEKSSSLEKALNLTSLEPLSTKEHPVVTGIQKWVLEYNESICDQAQLEQQISNFMTKYDKDVEKQKKQDKQKDDGGWTVVTKKGRNPGMSRKESVANKLVEKTDKGVKRKHLTDFYTFQKRESKMNHLADMRKKYEEDKKKVNIMKQGRKFKPF